MAVPAFKRHDSELKILSTANDLFKLIVILLKDQTSIAKKNKHLVLPMLSNVREVLYSISNANNHNLKDEFEKDFRKKFQMQAFEHLNKLVIDCKIFMEFNKDGNNAKIAKILNAVNDSKAMLKSWMKSDRGRS